MTRQFAIFEKENGCKAGRGLACAVIALCAVWLCLFGGGGCKSQPYVNAHIESVNAEYRQLEDYVYSLEEKNAQLQQELDAAKQLAASGALPGVGAPPPRGGLFRRGPAGRTPATPSDSDAPGFEPPVIELPGESSPSESPPRSSPPRSMFRPSGSSATELSSPADSPPSIDLPRPGVGSPPAEAEENVLPIPASPPERLPAKPKDTKITHVFVSPLTGGCDLDGQPGDDGLKVILEPRNAEDEYIAEAGGLSLVVLDPDREGDAARIARWDYDLDAARQILAEAGSGKGLKLEMPWPAGPPEASRLKLYVRYETADGRKIQTDRDIYVSPPGQAISRWTPRVGDGQRASHTEPAGETANR